MTYAILLISPGHWQQANTQQPIGVVGLVVIHVNGEGRKRKVCQLDRGLLEVHAVDVVVYTLDVSAM